MSRVFYYPMHVKEALLYDRLSDGKVRCRTCPRHCTIADGKTGWCTTRINKGGRLYTLIYGVVASMAVSPIEKKPIFHFYPGSKWISMGTYGCNFRCPGCQNWDISHAIPPKGAVYMTPQEVAEIARRHNCLGVSWTYNEPTIWLEYTIDCARVSKEAGLLTHYVTNGYITEEALDAIGPYLDCFRVDMKGFTEDSYFKTAHIKDFSPILKATKRAKTRWGMHVECVTNVTPGFNDDDSQLRGIASWIVEELGDDTPWHVTQFFPHHKLINLYPTPPETLERARRVGFETGLRYVYIGNIQGHPGEDTYCHNCQELLIKRWGFIIETYKLKDNQCPSCGIVIPGRFPAMYGKDYKVWEGYEVGVV